MVLYLDHAAATPVDPEVFEAMEPWFSVNFGNPSSIYQSGQEARAAIDHARMTIASFLNAKPTEVYFTGSGTESCNWALRGIVERKWFEKKPIHVVVSAIEHSSILETARYAEKLYGIELTILPVTQDGLIDVAVLKRVLRPHTLLVSIMTVNNEIGTLQPVIEIGKLCREKGVYFHTDACQASGYVDLNVQNMNIDLLTLNASKIYGPKGVGVLYVREGVKISPWTFGGGQEFALRAGTENVPAIVGMGKAIELIQEYDGKSISTLRDYAWKLIQESIDEVSLNGSMEHRAPNNLNIFIDGVDAEQLVRRLDLQDICVSTGSACASGTIEPSHVIGALGYSEQRARSSIRITLGKNTTKKDIESFAEILLENVLTLRK